MIESTSMDLFLQEQIEMAQMKKDSNPLTGHTAEESGICGNCLLAQKCTIRNYGGYIRRVVGCSSYNPIKEGSQ